MSYFINNQQKINDIVFANRNKNYGAYAIRSAYGNTILRSLFFMLIGFGSLMSTAYYLSNKNNNNDNVESILPMEQDTVQVIICDIKPPETSEQSNPSDAEQPRSSSSAEDAIGTRVVDHDTSAVNTTTSSLAVNTSTATGTEGPEQPNGGTNTGGNGNTGGASTFTTQNEPYVIADSSPEFEGGLKALYLFLASRLKYPEKAQDAGKQGVVHVKFVVDENGKVENLSLMNNLGYGLDEEALRVVSMIPKFKTPGMMNGRPVKVYYHLPIKFVLQH